MQREQELCQILSCDDRLVNILRLARSVALPNWYVGAGVVRNSVWDYLHDRPLATPIRDVDMIYFSATPLDDSEARKILSTALPGVEWDLKNSADVHNWYREHKGRYRTPLKSSEQDIDNWPETCSCIGLRLLQNDEIFIYAPYGIDDLMNIVFRRNVKGEDITPEVFWWRVEHKKIRENWPKVTIIP